MNIFNFLSNYIKNSQTQTYGDILNNEDDNSYNLNSILNTYEKMEYDNYHKSNLSRLQRFG